MPWFASEYPPTPAQREVRVCAVISASPPQGQRYQWVFGCASSPQEPTLKMGTPLYTN
jgi:hypothetical protein